MSSAIRESITKTFGFEPICVNSALVSAQNRNRLYWAGKRNKDGTYSKVDVKQPEDCGILIKDILDNGYDLTGNDKSWTLTASYNGAVPWNTIERCQRNMVAEPVIFQVPHGFNNGGIKYHKSPTLTANGSWQSNNYITEPVGVVQKRRCTKVEKNFSKCNGVVEPVTDTIRVGSLPRPNGELSTSQAMRIYSTEGKSVNLVSGGGGMGGKTGLYAIPIEFENNIPSKAISYADSKTYTVYEVKNGIITIKGKEYPIKLNDGYYIIRKLTVSECKRLQTVPEWYKFPVSDTQAYKMLGNGWTVDVIAHLIKATLNT